MYHPPDQKAALQKYTVESSPGKLKQYKQINAVAYVTVTVTLRKILKSLNKTWCNI